MVSSKTEQNREHMALAHYNVKNKKVLRKGKEESLYWQLYSVSRGHRIQSRVLSVPAPQIYNAKITLKLYYAFYRIMRGTTNVCVIWRMM